MEFSLYLHKHKGPGNFRSFVPYAISAAFARFAKQTDQEANSLSCRPRSAETRFLKHGKPTAFKSEKQLIVTEHFSCL